MRTWHKGYNGLRRQLKHKLTRIEALRDDYQLEAVWNEYWSLYQLCWRLPKNDGGFVYLDRAEKINTWRFHEEYRNEHK